MTPHGRCRFLMMMVASLIVASRGSAAESTAPSAKDILIESGLRDQTSISPFNIETRRGLFARNAFNGVVLWYREVPEWTGRGWHRVVPHDGGVHDASLILDVWGELSGGAGVRDTMDVMVADDDHRDVPFSASSHDVVTILKADPDTLAGRPGNGFRITWGWQAAPMDKDYTVFLHVLDEENRVVLQDDHEPPTPTSRWNGPVAYARVVPLEQWQVKGKRTIDIAPAEGRYAICAGLYDQKEGRKVLLHTGPGVTTVDEGRYRIGTLIVDAQAPIPGPGEKTLDLTGYRLTFNEEFDDLSVSAWGPTGPGGTRWIAHTPWHGDFGDARFTDPKDGFPFTVRDGLLRIEARKENDRWRSGLLSAVDPNGNGFKQKYGYFECRAKFPQGPGTWPAFWLMGLKSLRGMPGNTGPRINPEVDVVEHYGHWPWRYHYVLHQWGRDGAESRHDGKRSVVFGMEEDFHTYGVMIDPEYIILYFDGVELHRQRTPDSVKTPLFPLVNLALGPGWPTDKTPNPSYLYVDYVKVWQKRIEDGGGSCTTYPKSILRKWRN